MATSGLAVSGGEAAAGSQAAKPSAYTDAYPRPVLDMVASTGRTAASVAAGHPPHPDPALDKAAWATGKGLAGPVRSEGGFIGGDQTTRCRVRSACGPGIATRCGSEPPH